MADRTCILDGCERIRHYRDYCQMHRRRIDRHGVPGPAGRVRIKRADYPKCIVDGCSTTLIYARGWCALHYQRQFKFGDPGEGARRRRLRGTGTRFISGDGYVKLREYGGEEVFEHRLVMETMIGRPLLPEESVHHKNGIRHDNQPGNLELWVGWGKQPSRPACRGSDRVRGRALPRAGGCGTQGAMMADDYVNDGRVQSDVRAEQAAAAAEQGDGSR
jgi:hypothetical protein